jgi:thiol-disulfide isomerase/thioredoxin
VIISKPIKRFLFILVLLMAGNVYAQQTAKEVLQKSQEACNKIYNGYLVVNYEWGRVVNSDSVTGIEVFFDKKSNDKKSEKYYLIKNNGIERCYNGDSAIQVNHTKKHVDVDTVYYDYVNGKPEFMILDLPFISYNPYSVLDNPDVKIYFDSTFSIVAKGIRMFYLWDEDEKRRIWYVVEVDSNTYLPLSFKETKVFKNDIAYGTEKKVSITYTQFNNPAFTDSITHYSAPKNYTVTYRQRVYLAENLAVGNIAPNWAGKTIKGDSITFAGLAAKVYILDFWYKRCAPCVDVMKNLQQLHTKYQSQGLKVVGINCVDSTDNTLQSFLSTKGVNYVNVICHKTMLNDYKVWAHPTLYIADANRKILYVSHGQGKDEQAEIETIITEYLETH